MQNFDRLPDRLSSGSQKGKGKFGRNKRGTASITDLSPSPEDRELKASTVSTKGPPILDTEQKNLGGEELWRIFPNFPSSQAPGFWNFCEVTTFNLKWKF